jgi:hypothetical protein
MNTPMGLVLFLLFAEDSGCLYARKIAAPLAWVHMWIAEPLPSDLISVARCIEVKGERHYVRRFG